MSQTNVPTEFNKPNTDLPEATTLVVPAENESAPGAWVLCRPVGCFDRICSKEGSAEAALRFRDDRTKPWKGDLTKHMNTSVVRSRLPCLGI
jgi:hypothetical protein